jgi:outer membrane immunogenic protein
MKLVKNLLFGCAAGLITVTTVQAADLPVKAPAPAGAVDSWTGFYFGGNFGYGWGLYADQRLSATLTFPTGFVFNNADATGQIGGAQIGYDHQFSRWLLGVRAMFDWGPIEGTATPILSPLLAGGYNLQTREIDRLVTVDVRLGYTLDHFLWYVVAGPVSPRYSNFSLVYGAGGVFVGTAYGQQFELGYNVGGGAEFKLTQNWSAAIEYNYAAFDNNVINLDVLTGSAISATHAVTNQVQMLSLGINYRIPVTQ